MLTLIRSPQGGQESIDTPKRRPRKCAALTLSRAERARLKAAVRNLRRAFGSYGCLAEVTGIPKHTLENAGSTSIAGHAIAFALARVAGVSVEQLLSTRPVDAACCPLCGARRST